MGAGEHGCWGAWVAGDMHDGGGCVAGWTLVVRGACTAGVGGHVWWGVHDRGCAWQGGVAGETATAPDGTHPTGMHSCFWRKGRKC